MKNSFNNTVSSLVNAYLNGTLLKGHCAACAVGNICAVATGARIIDAERWNGSMSSGGANWSNGSPYWASVFYTSNSGDQTVKADRFVDAAKSQIEATGYTWQELARVEFAFETAMPGVYNEEAEFAGLMAVVDVLADIHGIDLQQAEEAKLLFAKA
jgi:hypothetical protein